MDAVMFARALDEAERRVRAVPNDGWARRTPCREWDVRTLVNHLVNELVWMPPLLHGATVADVGGRFDGDLLGEAPLVAFRAAREDAEAAVREPGVADRSVHVSFGDLPASEYITQVGCDLVVHAWDVARAIGDDDRLDDDLVAAAYDYLGPRADDARGAGVFGPAVPLPTTAGAQAQLLGVTGRDPAWR